MDTNENLDEVACSLCGRVHSLPELSRREAAHCSRCGHVLRKRTEASLHITGALALCALILYFPANLFPILKMNMYGTESQNTILTGVIRFFQDGDYFVAVAVLLASIVIPFLKILGLLFLVLSSYFKSARARKFRLFTFNAVEVLGRWAMLDVFALAVLISLVKLQRLANVVPGKGALAFVLVIFFTILSSASYDSQLIWENQQDE